MNFDFDANTGRPFNYFSFGAAASEVEIDCLTGDHKVQLQGFTWDAGSNSA